MTKFFGALALSLALTLSLVAQAFAQTGTPPPGRTGTVTGQIANGTAGSSTPGDLAVMLHAWDDSGETVMLDGRADASGAFRFDNVPMQDGWAFAAMLTYNDVTFFSESGVVESGTKALALPLTVYEPSPDASAVRVAQMHVFLDFGPGEVSVGEIYILSNPTDRAVVGGLTLPDGRPATVQFALPAGANKVGFEGDGSGQRFIITPDGFADTGAVLPGEGTAQVMVTYVLPYVSGMTVEHAVGQPVDARNVLIRADAGVAVGGPGIGAPTPRQLGSGETFNIYAAGPLQPGDSLTISLTGEPTYRTQGGATTQMAAPQTSELAAFADRWAFPIAGGLLGVAMIAVGLWWWRRPAPLDQDAKAVPGSAAEWPAALQAIVSLDEARERGEIDDEDYRARRAELRAQAKAMLRDRETPE